jgi:hypothetical protein
MWYRVWFERLTFKNISISFYTSGDDRKWLLTYQTPIRTPQLRDLSSIKISSLYLSWFLRKWKSNFWISQLHISWPEVTTDILVPLMHTAIERSIIHENFTTLSIMVFEKMEKQFLNFSTPYLMTGSDFFKIVWRYNLFHRGRSDTLRIHLCCRLNYKNLVKPV